VVELGWLLLLLLLLLLRRVGVEGGEVWRAGSVGRVGHFVCLCVLCV